MNTGTTHDTASSEPWYQDEPSDNIQLVASYMAGSSEFSKDDIVLMLEKPWNHEDVYREAKAAYEAELAAERESTNSRA
jgi:hypothetical protein